MDQPATASVPSTDEEQLLLAMADGSYLVAAGDGTVRECGEDLAARVGLCHQDAIGRPLTELLRLQDGQAGLDRAVAGPEREVTVALQPPAPAARARVVPVPLSLGWEVTTLLGDIGVRDPVTWTAASLHAQHAAAIDVVLDRGTTEPGARLAGILVIVRPPGGQLLDRTGVTLRRDDRAAADAVRAAAAAAQSSEVAAGAATIDTAQSAGATLDDLVADARELRRRLDESETAVIAARSQAEDSAAALVDAELARAALQTELDETRGGAGAATAELARLQEELAAARSQTERLVAALAEAQAARAALQGELQDTVGGAGATTAALSRQAEELAQELAESRAALAGSQAARAGMADDLAEAEQARERLRAELDEARGGAGAVTAERSQLAAELASTVEALEQAQAEAGELPSLRDALELALAEAANLRLERDAAAAGHDAAVQERDRLRQEAAHVQDVADSLRNELGAQRGPESVVGPPAPVVTAGAAAGAEPVVDERAPLPAATDRAFAIVGPNGCFERLDKMFCGLLGYQEHELLGAGWPSIIDADNAREHRELARQLRTGERDEADVATFYMHARGLLVGIEARVTRWDDGGGDRLLVAVAVEDA